MRALLIPIVQPMQGPLGPGTGLHLRKDWLHQQQVMMEWGHEQAGYAKVQWEHCVCWSVLLLSASNILSCVIRIDIGWICVMDFIEPLFGTCHK